MKIIRDIWKGILPPTNYNVLWLDTSEAKPVLKTFLNQKWQEVSGYISSPIFLNICTEDPGGEPIVPTISKEKVMQIKREFESGVSTVLQISNIIGNDVPEYTVTVDVNRMYMEASGYDDGISKWEYHLNWLSHDLYGNAFFKCINFAIPEDITWETLPLRITSITLK